MAGALESVGFGNQNINSVVSGERELSAQEVTDLTGKFKSLVDGAKVLDGNIILDQGSNKLMRVSYGCNYWRKHRVSTQGRVATTNENIATRKLFGMTMSARVNQMERDGRINPERANQLRRLVEQLNGNQENVKPLSRRTISQVMTCIDEAVDAGANGNEMPENDRPRLGTWKSTPWKLVGNGDNGVRLSQKQYAGMFDDALLAIQNEILPRLPEDQRAGDLLDRVKVQIQHFKGLYEQGNNFGELENILQGGLDATSIGEKILQRLNVRIVDEQFNAPAQNVQQEQQPPEIQQEQQQPEIPQEQEQPPEIQQEQQQPEIPQEQQQPEIQQEQQPPEIQQEQQPPEIPQEQEQPPEIPPEIPRNKVIKHPGVVSENTFQKLNALWQAEETSGANELGAKVDLGKLRSVEGEKAQKLCGDDPQKIERYKGFCAERKFISNFIFDSFVGNMARGRDDGERLMMHLMENADAALSCIRDLQQMDNGGAKPGWYATLEKNAPELLDVFKNFLGAVSENVDVTPQTTAVGFQNLVFAKRETICGMLKDLETSIDDAAKKMVERVADDLVANIGRLCTTDERTKIDLVVLKHLMKDATPDDRRRLLAAAIREDGVGRPSAGWGDVSTPCGLVRGMGVYANKILQGLPLLQESAIEDESLKALRAAVADARNSLPPIDETMLKAELYNAVAGKDGGADIKGITVHAVLGAGSVAETLACTITREVDDPNGGGKKIMQKDDVIVKVLRPDIKPAFDRQAEIVKKLIENPGQDFSIADKAILEGSYHSRVAAFAEECDSRRELLNALRGARTFGRPLDQKGENEKTLKVTYSVGGKEVSFVEKNTVGSEGLILKPEFSGPEHADIIAKAINEAQDDAALNKVLDKYFVTGNDTCFIIERAQGTDVQKLNGAFKERQAKDFGISPEASREERLQALKDERTPFIAMNRSLAQLKESFVKSALFGKEHFFHCDLTAGNLVYEPTTGALTVIDYGKAAALSDAEAEALAMVQELECNPGAAANGAVMLRAYRKLLTAETARCEELDKRKDLDAFTRQENAAYLKQLKAAATQLSELGDADAETLFADLLAKLKNANDPRASSAFGAFATVVSEVGSYLSGVYLPIPSAVQNFVDTYVRLQNTIADVQGNIRALDGEINAGFRESALEKIDGKLASLMELKTPLEQLGSLEMRVESKSEKFDNPDDADDGSNRRIVHICESKTNLQTNDARVKTFTTRLGDLRQRLAQASTLAERSKAMNALLALVTAEERRLKSFQDEVLTGSLLMRIKSRIASTVFNGYGDDESVDVAGPTNMNLRFVDDCRVTLAGGTAPSLANEEAELLSRDNASDNADGEVFQGLARLKELRETLQTELQSLYAANESNVVHANGPESQVSSVLTAGELDEEDTVVLHSNLELEDSVFNGFVAMMVNNWGAFFDENLVAPDSCRQTLVKYTLQADDDWKGSFSGVKNVLTDELNYSQLNDATQGHSFEVRVLPKTGIPNDGNVHFDGDYQVYSNADESKLTASELDAPADGELLDAFKELLSVSGAVDRVRLPKKPTLKNLLGAVDGLIKALCPNNYRGASDDTPLTGATLEVLNRLCELQKRLPFKLDTLVYVSSEPTLDELGMCLSMFRSMVAYSSRHVVDAQGRPCQRPEDSALSSAPELYKIVTGQELPEGKVLTRIDCKRLLDTCIDRYGATGAHLEGAFHLDDCGQTPLSPEQMKKFQTLLKAAEDLQLDVSKWKTSDGNVPESVSVKAYHQLCNELKAVYDACEPHTDDDTVLVKTILAEAAKTGGKFKGLGDDKDVGPQYRAFGVPPKGDLPKCPDGLEGTYFALTRFVKAEAKSQYAEQANAVQARNALTLKNHLRQRLAPLGKSGAVTIKDYRKSQEEFETGYGEKLEACFSHVLDYLVNGNKGVVYEKRRASDPYLDALRAQVTKTGLAEPENGIKDDQKKLVVKSEWSDFSKLTDGQKAILTEAAVRMELWKGDFWGDKNAEMAKFPKARAEDPKAALDKAKDKSEMEGDVLNEEELKGVVEKRQRNEVLGKARTEARKTLSGCRQITKDDRDDFAGRLDKAKTPEECAQIAEEARKADDKALADTALGICRATWRELRDLVNEKMKDDEAADAHFRGCLKAVRTLNDVNKVERDIRGYDDFKSKVAPLKTAADRIVDGNLKSSLLADLKNAFDESALPGLQQKVELGKLLTFYKHRIDQLPDGLAAENCQKFLEGVVTEEGLTALHKMVVKAEADEGVNRPESALDGQPAPKLDTAAQNLNGTLKGLTPSTRLDVTYRQTPNLNTGFLMAVVNGLARTRTGNDYLQGLASGAGLKVNTDDPETVLKPEDLRYPLDEKTGSPFERAFLAGYSQVDKEFRDQLEKGVRPSIDETKAANCLGLVRQHQATPITPDDGDFGSEGDLARFVRAELARDHVLTLDFGNGRYCTLVGYNADTGEFMLADPNQSGVTDRYKGVTFGQLALQNACLSSYTIVPNAITDELVTDLHKKNGNDLVEQQKKFLNDQKKNLGLSRKILVRMEKALFTGDVQHDIGNMEGLRRTFEHYLKGTEEGRDVMLEIARLDKSDEREKALNEQFVMFIAQYAEFSDGYKEYYQGFNNSDKYLDEMTGFLIAINQKLSKPRTLGELMTGSKFFAEYASLYGDLVEKDMETVVETVNNGNLTNSKKLANIVDLAKEVADKIRGPKAKKDDVKGDGKG